MVKKNKGIMGRTDIPLAQRMQMQRMADIAHNRDEAARIALHISCVALNDTEGLGYSRLCRFARHLKKLIDEYYADPEVGEVHLNKRLEQMGFRVIDGRLYAAEDSKGNIVPRKLLEEQENANNQN
jgi:hypothetical protein